MDEECGKLYYKLYGLHTYGMRYFNMFGRRQDPNGAYAAVIPQFIKQLLNHEQPIINGDGRQSRDFTYIENVIEANLKKRVCQVIRRRDRRIISLTAVVRIDNIYADICFGQGIEPIFGPDRKGDIKHNNADISKARDFWGTIQIIALLTESSWRLIGIEIICDSTLKENIET